MKLSPPVVLLSLIMVLGFGCTPDPSGSKADAVGPLGAGCEPGDSYGIVGGHALSLGNSLSSSTVMVVSNVGDGSYDICTGTLIDQNVVLTAAHCRVPNGNTKIVFTRGIGCDPNALDSGLTVTESVVNPNYDTSDGTLRPAANDLSLMKFSGDIPAGFRVRPLPTEDFSPSSATEIVMSGYGKTEYTKKDSGNLRYTTTSISHLSDRMSGPGVKTDIKIPDTWIVTQPDHGICQGDSGGALYAKTRDGLVLIGVTSMVADPNGAKSTDKNEQCRAFGVFTDVRSHLAWIQDTTERLSGHAFPNRQKTQRHERGRQSQSQSPSLSDLGREGLKLTVNSPSSLMQNISSKTDFFAAGQLVPKSEISQELMSGHAVCNFAEGDSYQGTVNLQGGQVLKVDRVQDESTDKLTAAAISLEGGHMVLTCVKLSHGAMTRADLETSMGSVVSISTGQN